MPQLDPQKCIVCMRDNLASNDTSINLCSDDCIDEYRDVLNEMSEAYADAEPKLELES